MTNRLTVIAGVALVALLGGSPAWEGYEPMPKGTVQRVGKLGLLVTPLNDWNRLGAKIGRNAEGWTLNDLSLNDLTLCAGIEEGRTLFLKADNFCAKSGRAFLLEFRREGTKKCVETAKERERSSAAGSMSSLTRSL